MNAILEPRFLVTRTDVEKLISVAWGYKFSITIATGQRAGILEYRITGTFPTEAMRQRANAIRGGKRDNRNLGLILNVLCEIGDIPPGRYSIRESLPPITSQMTFKAGDLKVIGVAV